VALPGGSGDIDPDDSTIFSLQVPQNKQYYVMLNLLGVATHLSFILVVKLHSMPVLWDFYGGERISKSAVMFIVSFTRQQTVNISHFNVPGVENLIERNGSIYILGRTFTSNKTVSLFFGMMPTAYDRDLCAQCRKVSDATCGFCVPRSVNESLESVVMQVSLALPDCLYWNESDSKWNNYGCKVTYNNYSFAFLIFEDYTLKTLQHICKIFVAILLFDISKFHGVCIFIFICIGVIGCSGSKE